LAICEYLENTCSPKLHPQDPWLKALNRAWMEQNGSYFNYFFNMIDAGSMEDFQKARNVLINKLQSLDYAVSGPFFNGNDFALIDAVSAPFMEALRQVEALTECRVFTNLPKLKEWAAQLAQHPSVVNALANNLHDHWYNQLVQRQSFLSQRVR
jgi:glutathione S-transferase